jgi:NADH-quinone oxidoreductase subunit G
MKFYVSYHEVNEAVNYRWICDIGRFGFDQFNSRERVTSPFILNENRERQTVTWGKAINTVVNRLKEIRQNHGADAIAGLIAPRPSNETIFMFQQFFREVLGSPNIDHRTDQVVYQNDDAYLISIGLNAANDPFTEIRKADSILILGSDLPNELPILHLQVRERAVRSKVPVYLAHSRITRLDKDIAGTWVYRPGTDLAFLIGLVQQIAQYKNTALSPHIQHAVQEMTPEKAAEITGVPLEQIRDLAEDLCLSKLPTILLGEQAHVSAQGVTVVQFAAEIARLLNRSEDETLPLSLLLPYNNSRGALDMGCLPHREPGLKPAEKVGKNTTEILQGCIDGSIKALILFSTNLVEEYPNRPLVEKALQTVPFVVVADMFTYPVTQYASVFLPMAAYSEEDGTYTNLSGRVQRAEEALQQLDGTLTGFQILLALGERWGAGWKQVLSTRIFDMLTSAVAHYSGMSWSGLGSFGFMPKRIHPEFFAIDRRIEPITAEFLLPQAPQEYPFRFVRGRFLFDDAREKKYAPPLVQRMEPAVAEITPADARQLGVENGSLVKIQGRLGEIELPVNISSAVHTGCVSVLGDYHALALNGVVEEQFPWVRILND